VGPERGRAQARLTIQGEHWVDAETEEDALDQVRERFEQQDLPDPDRISAIFPD
jgi:hypothetical protein